MLDQLPMVSPYILYKEKYHVRDVLQMRTILAIRRKMEELNGKNNKILSQEPVATNSQAQTSPSSNDKNPSANTIKPSRTFLVIVIAGFVIPILSDISGLIAAEILALLFTFSSCLSASQGLFGCSFEIAFIFIPIMAFAFTILYSLLLPKLLIKRNMISINSKKAFWLMFCISLILHIIFFTCYKLIVQ